MNKIDEAVGLYLAWKAADLESRLHNFLSMLSEKETSVFISRIMSTSDSVAMGLLGEVMP